MMVFAAAVLVHNLMKGSNVKQDRDSSLSQTLLQMYTNRRNRKAEVEAT